MKPSTVVQEWIQQGEQRGVTVLRAKLLQYLRRHFGGDVPTDLRGKSTSPFSTAGSTWPWKRLPSISRAGLPPQANGQ